MSHGDDRYERGHKHLAAMDAEAPARLARLTEQVAPDLERYTLEYAYGDVFNRPGLDRRTRQIVTITTLAALGNAAPQLRSHIRNAISVGVSREEISEVMIQLSVYAGFPAALNGVNAAREVFAALDAEADAAAS